MEDQVGLGNSVAKRCLLPHHPGRLLSVTSVNRKSSWQGHCLSSVPRYVTFRENAVFVQSQSEQC